MNKFRRYENILLLIVGIIFCILFIHGVSSSLASPVCGSQFIAYAARDILFTYAPSSPIGVFPLAFHNCPETLFSMRNVQTYGYYPVELLSYCPINQEMTIEFLTDMLEQDMVFKKLQAEILSQSNLSHEEKAVMIVACDFQAFKVFYEVIGPFYFRPFADLDSMPLIEIADLYWIPFVFEQAGLDYSPELADQIVTFWKDNSSFYNVANLDRALNELLTTAK